LIKMGRYVFEQVSGFTGFVVGLSQHLGDSSQALVQPEPKNGEHQKPQWFPVARLRPAIHPSGRESVNDDILAEASASPATPAATMAHEPIAPNSVVAELSPIVVNVILTPSDNTYRNIGLLAEEVARAVRAALRT
jgi:hypothetical protein